MLRTSEAVGDVVVPPSCVREPWRAPISASIADYLHDESKLAAHGVASLAVPESVEALREVMAWHAHHGHIVAVSGTRTGVAGGAVPSQGAHLVSLAALRGVVRVDNGGEGRDRDGARRHVAL